MCLQRQCGSLQNLTNNVPTYKAVEARADELRRDRKKKTKNDVVVRLASLVHQVRGPCAARCDTLDSVQAHGHTLTVIVYHYHVPLSCTTIALLLRFWMACREMVAATHGVILSASVTVELSIGAPDWR